MQEQLKTLQEKLLDLNLSNNLIKLRETKARGLTIKNANSADVIAYLCDTSDKYLFSDNTVIEAQKSYLNTDYSDKELEKRLLTTYKEYKAHIEEQGINVLFLTLGAIKWYAADNSSDVILSPILLLPIVLKKNTEKGQNLYELECEDKEVKPNETLYIKMKQDFGISLPVYDTDEPVFVYLEKIKNVISKMKNWEVLENEMRINLFSFQKLLMYYDLNDENWSDTKPSDNFFIQKLLSNTGNFQEKETTESLARNADTARNFRLDALNINEIDHVLDADNSQSRAIEMVFKNKALVIQGPPGTGKSQTIVNIIASCVRQGKTVLFVSEKLAALEVVERRLKKVGLGEAYLELHSHKANRKSVLASIAQTLDKKSAKRVAENDIQLADFAAIRRELNDYYTIVFQPIGESEITPYVAMGKMLSIKQECPDVYFWGDIDTKWSARDIKKRREAIKSVCDFVKENENIQNSPFVGSTKTDIGRVELERLERKIKEISGDFTDFVGLIKEIASILDVLGVNDIKSTKTLLSTAKILLEKPEMDGIRTIFKYKSVKKEQLEHIFELGTRFHTLKSDYNAKIRDAAHVQEFYAVKRLYETKGKSALRFIYKTMSSDFKTAEKQLLDALKITPNSYTEEMELINVLIEKHEIMSALKDLEHITKQIFLEKEAWNFEKNTDWLDRKQGIEYIYRIIEAQNTESIVTNTIEKLDIAAMNFKKQTQSALDLLEKIEYELPLLFKNLDFDEDTKQDFYSENTPLLLLQKRIEAMYEQFNLLDIYCQWNTHQTQLIALNCTKTIEKLLNLGKNKIDDILHFYEYALHFAFYDEAEKRNPVLKTSKLELADKFRAADKYLIEQYNTAKIKYTHLGNIPSSEMSGASMSVLRAEMKKKIKHKPLRKLFEEAGDIILQIKPVFMMSPLSVAQFLRSEHFKFDYVIFDEASQVKPVDAFGALLRATNAVIVGDEKQLPPSNFFTQTDEDGDYDENAIYNNANDMDSVLDLFCTQNAKRTMLEWHYRSKHESLVAVSNKEFYKGKLIVLPSNAPQSKEFGLLLAHHPEAYYNGGGKNEAEAMEVVKAIYEHAIKFPDPNKSSLGIVAFGVSQRDCIENLLAVARKKDTDFDKYLNRAERAEYPFFVKNLENVQGDERDVIFVSICYGKSQDGRLLKRFGPVNNKGGERRLNVLFTRAKEKCVLFSNFKASDLRLETTDAKGLQVLKEFLEYAENRSFTNINQTNKGTDSPFEDAVMAALEREGYTVDTQVGSAGYFVDLAIPDKTQAGRYLLGIECDGATYHSSKAARDRDRLRQTVLEGLGWNIYRIWSTDWFKQPTKEMEKLRKHINDLENGRSIEKPKEKPKVTLIDRLFEQNTTESIAPIKPFSQNNAENVKQEKDKQNEIIRLEPETIPHILQDTTQNKEKTPLPREVKVDRVEPTTRKDYGGWKKVSIQAPTKETQVHNAPVFQPPIKLETEKWKIPYTQALVNLNDINRDIANESDYKLIQIIVQFLKTEAPTHQDYLKIIILEQLGINISDEITTKFEHIFKKGAACMNWEQRGQFLWLPNQKLEKLRSRSENRDLNLNQLEWVAPEEIQIALKYAGKQGITNNEEELMKLTLQLINAKLFLDKKNKDIIQSELDRLLLSQLVIKIDNKILPVQ
jgi:very-short-patch-repair endonuclease